MFRTQSAARLLKGMLWPDQRCRVHWERRLQELDYVDVLSTDVFNTLLIQAPRLDAAVMETVGREIPKRLRQVHPPLPIPDEEVPAALRSTAAAMTDRVRARGPSIEVPHRRLYHEFLRDLGAGAYCEVLVDELMQHELHAHFRLTHVNPAVTDLINTASRHGKRVVAVSDTYLGADDLAALLRMHGIKNIDRIYASCDLGLTKFHGNLFRHMLAQEGIAPRRLLHIGDNRLADVWSARAFGIRSLHYRPGTSRSAPSRQQLADPEFRVGYQSLGPIFAVFSQLLLIESRDRRISRLACVARDGDLLREATTRLAASARCLDAPRLDYVYFSRRSVALPHLRKLDAEALRQVRSIRADGPLLEGLLAYLCIDLDALPDDLARKVHDDPPDVDAFLADSRLSGIVEEKWRHHESVLGAYLRQEGLWGATEAAALVDVGWRATIQTALNETFVDRPGFTPMAGFYIGLWSESVPLPSPGDAPAWGLLGDLRRGRGLLEGAFWQLAFVFEAVCRAAHGTVIGYERDAQDRIQPVLAAGTMAREAELAREERIARIREGILAYIDAWGESIGPSLPVPLGLRLRTQWHAFRLAFFPRRWEIETLGDLVHTESHAESWSVPLISKRRPSPLTAPREWMAGLASPWRSGYVAATGGPLLSLAFVLLEGLLNHFPGMRTRLQENARKRAGL